MSPTATSFSKEYPYSVSVETRGAKGTVLEGYISDPDLKVAIERAIERSRLFRDVAAGKGADYILTVTVVPVPVPPGNTFSLEAGWLLVRTIDKVVVMRKAVTSSYTVTSDADSNPGIRFRLAKEGAARANISQGLQSIAELSL